jgi:hypothetical protein
MVNSRQLAEGVAMALGKPLTSTAQHIKNLREAKGSVDGKPLVTAGGRGRNAPTMSRRDAATLICALMGSEAVQDSVRTIEWMRELKPSFHGYRWNGRYRWENPEFEIGIRPDDDVIEALERVLKFFDGEKVYRQNLERSGRPDAEIYFRFCVEFPQRFVSLSFGVRRMVSAAWTYGRRLGSRDRQARWCEQDELREIALISAPAESK